MNLLVAIFLSIPILAFAMCIETILSTARYDIGLMHQMVFKDPVHCPSFHFTSCQTQTCSTGEACNYTVNCGELVCFLFVLCHSQDDPPALCQEMEKGISGCSTLTKLSLHCLPPKCYSASVQAAMALQSSLTEVEWSNCDFYDKSDSVAVLVCGVWCLHGCVVRDCRRGERGIVRASFHAFD